MAERATVGALLAGGRARRMGGGDKALCAVGGQSILSRVAERLAPQCAGLVLSANGDPARFASLGWPVAADDPPGFAGPLAGILAALDWTAANRPDALWVASAATDAPFLPRDLVARLHLAREEAGALVACAASGGRRHPVIALWPVGLRADLRRALVEEGERKVERFAARWPLAVVEWPVSPVDPFFNANTPADLAEAERLAARHPEA